MLRVSEKTEESNDRADNEGHVRYMTRRRNASAPIVEDAPLFAERNVLRNGIVYAITVGDVKIHEV